MKREPARHPDNRQLGFDASFDSDTLFYAAVHDLESNKVRVLGPPLLNLEAAIIEAKWSLSLTGETAPSISVFPQLEKLDRFQRLSFSCANLIPNSISISFRELGNISIPIERAEKAGFKGRNVLITQSKDNELTWIRDWAHFHAYHHGVDAVLFFDNGSKAYPIEKIHETLAGVPGMKVVEVVAWPFPWGPPKAKGRGAWDSNFGQHGALEFARWRFLQEANWVLNLDVDELLVSPDAWRLDDWMNSSPLVGMVFPGGWTHTSSSVVESSTNLRHRDCLWSQDVDFTRMGTKWCVRPVGSEEVKQWKTHVLAGLATGAEISSIFQHRHFRQISTHWKYNRSKVPNIGTLHYDSLLATYFSDLGWM